MRYDFNKKTNRISIDFGTSEYETRLLTVIKNNLDEQICLEKQHLREMDKAGEMFAGVDNEVDVVATAKKTYPGVKKVPPLPESEEWVAEDLDVLPELDMDDVQAEIGD